MASTFLSGSLLMKAEQNDENIMEDEMGFPDGYPFAVPKVYLDGMCEAYYPQVSFSWDRDSVVLVRDKKVIEYAKWGFAELKAKDKDGNIIWVDGRSAPYAGTWDGEYLDETRGGKEYTITEYDIETAQKTKYKVILDETTAMDVRDYDGLSEYVDEETLGSRFFIKDGILQHYFGNDKEFIIPEHVNELGPAVLPRLYEFDRVWIPKTLVSISPSFITMCKTKRVEVDPENPKYYTKNGCLIDRETKTLVWAYDGKTIPNDGSVEIIGASAFYSRKDLEDIVIPDTITEIGFGAFSECLNLTKVEIPDSVIEIGGFAFNECLNLTKVEIPDSVIEIGSYAFYECEKLTEIKLPSLLTMIENHTFSRCRNLARVQIPDSLRTIESTAFSYCSSLKEIDLPEDCVEEVKNRGDKRIIKKNDEWCMVEPEKPDFKVFTL